MTMMIIVFEMYHDQRFLNEREIEFFFQFKMIMKTFFRQKSLLNFARFLATKTRESLLKFSIFNLKKSWKTRKKSSHNLSIARSIVALTRKLVSVNKTF
jgi:hypothetical protein